LTLTVVIFCVTRDNKDYGYVLVCANTHTHDMLNIDMVINL